MNRRREDNVERTHRSLYYLVADAPSNDEKMLRQAVLPSMQTRRPVVAEC